MSRRRSALALLTALILFLLAIGLPGAASAGGPTSVLLVVPGTGRTASLYTGSPEYEELSRLVGVGGAWSGEQQQVTPAELAGVSGVTITWLIHDAQIWRVDRVDLSPADGPSITTQENWGDGEIWAAPAQTHPSVDGRALVALFNRLGLDADGTAEPVASKPVSAADVPVPVRPSAAGASVTDGWVWGLAGVLLGAALTLLGLVLGRRVLAARSPGPAPDDQESDQESLDPEDDLELLDSRTP